jgi:hypothetical protein
VIVRSIVDTELASTLRKAATTFALQLGAWRPHPARGARGKAGRPRRKRPVR